MPRDPLWIILTEEGDIDGYERGATLEDAARTLYGPDEDLTGASGILVNADIRRMWRNARRRERYAERRAAGWRPKSRPSPVPEGFPRVEFGYMAELATRDQRGRCRCPRCSRFCRPEDFAPQPTSMQMAGAVVCYAPSCWRCQGMEKAPYAIDAPVYTGYPSPIEEYP